MVRMGSPVRVRKSAPLIPTIPEILDFGNFFMLYVKCMNDRQS